MDDMAMEREEVELRFDVPRYVADILDGVRTARRIPRASLLIQIVSDWADAKDHEATLVKRMTNGNGNQRAISGKGRAD